MGTNTAIFTLLDAVAFRSLSAPNPEQGVEITTIYRNGQTVPLSYAVFDHIQHNQRVFSALFGWTGEGVSDLEMNGSLSLASVTTTANCCCDWYQLISITFRSPLV